MGGDINAIRCQRKRSADSRPGKYPLSVIAKPWEVSSDFVSLRGPSGIELLQYASPPGTALDINLEFDTGPRPIRDAIDLNLRRLRRPVFAGTVNEDGTGHMELIVGWNPPGEGDGTGSYLTLDPWDYPSHINIRDAGWEERVDQIWFWKPTSELRPMIFVEDDPAPIELSVSNPSGERTGFDPVSGNRLYEDPSANYYELRGETDPLDLIPSADPEKFLTVKDPAEGTYRFEVTGTGEGPFTLSFGTVSIGDRQVLETVSEDIAPGETFKYELAYSRTGTSTFQQVDNFTPLAHAGADLTGTTGSPLAFDASSSFDPDGAIAAHAWDFGDGTTSHDATPSHAYEQRGTYTATLSVTDDQGASTTDTVRVVVSPTDPDPPATTAALSPEPNAAGWHNADVTVSLDAVDNEGGSGVREIAYRAVGAQPIDATTVSGASTELTIAAEGTTTLTFAATDNDHSAEAEQTLDVRIDRTPPASAITYPADGARLEALNFLAGAVADDRGIAGPPASARWRPACGARPTDCTGTGRPGWRTSAGSPWTSGSRGAAPASTRATARCRPGRCRPAPTCRTAPIPSARAGTDAAGNAEAPRAGTTLTVAPRPPAGGNVVVDLGALPYQGTPGTHGGAYDVNAAVHVVGQSATSGFWTQPFLWRDGALTDLGGLPLPDGKGSHALGINAADQVVGYSVDRAGAPHAFLWQDGEVTDLGAECDGRSLAYDINAAGLVVGTCINTSGGGFVARAVLWRDGEMTDLGTLPGGTFSDARGVNAAGAVVGVADAPGLGRLAFLWEDGEMRAIGLDIGLRSVATAINDDGLVVGYIEPSDFDEGPAFVWHDGAVQQLGFGVPTAINAAGQVVGTSGERAVVWNGGVKTDLNDLLPPGSGWELVVARGITDDGTIVGMGYHEGQERAFLLYPPGGGNPGPTDEVPPVTTAAFSQEPNAAGWHNAGVTGDPDGHRQRRRLGRPRDRPHPQRDRPDARRDGHHRGGGRGRDGDPLLRHRQRRQRRAPGPDRDRPPGHAPAHLGGRACPYLRTRPAGTMPR